MKNPYEILGVSRNATEDEIKKAYKDLARKWHPDLHKGDKKSEEKFKEINSAYQEIQSGKANNNFDVFPGFNAYKEGFSAPNFNSFFEGFFGGPFNRQSYDMKAKIYLTFEEAFNGCQKQVKISNRVKCDNCNGIGVKTSNNKCKKCNGNGQFIKQMGALNFSSRCNSCNGSGKENLGPCNSCNGYGKINKDETIIVNIPTGTKYNSVISPRKNLKLIVDFQKHLEFSLGRNLIDIYSKKDIDIFDAILGGNVIVNTLIGKKDVKIPAGIQSGTLLRIKNAGFYLSTYPSEQGDHIIEINIKIPKNLNEKQKKLFLNLKESWKGENNVEG